MKRTLLGGLVLALALMVGQVGTSEAAGQNIMYDGFCDGVNLNYDIFTGLATGVQTGCGGAVTGDMLGTVANVFGQGPALSMAYSANSTYAPSGFLTVIRADHTWTHYQNLTGAISVFNSGTWSPGIAVAPLGGGGPSGR